MKRTRSWAGVLMLGITLAACADGGPLAVADSAEFGSDALAALLSAETDGMTAPGHVTTPAGVPLFDRLAGQIPGFGGLYRAARCGVVLVLVGSRDVGAAVAIVRDAVEPLVAETCPNGIRVGVERGQFTYIELQRFLAVLLPLVDAEGVLRVNVDYSLNRIVIVVARRTVAVRVGNALPELGVPARAVVFRGASRVVPAR